MNEQMDVSTGFPSVTAGCPRSAQLHPVSLGSWYDLFITEHLVCCSPHAPPAVCGAVRSLMQLVPSLCWITLFLRCLSARRIYGMARLLGDFPLPSAPTCYITPPPSPHPSATLIVCMYIYHPSLSLLPSGESNTGKQECRRCTGWSALVAESSETL